MAFAGRRRPACQSFVHKQGIHADAAGTFLDGIADAKSQAERAKSFAGERTTGGLPV